jgi:hypothetical protein
MDQDSKLLTEAYLEARRFNPIAFDLRKAAKRLSQLYDIMQKSADYPDSIDDEYEQLNVKFWIEIRKAVRYWLVRHGKSKLASAYAAEMSDSDVNSPTGILDLLGNDRAMLANYYEFLDASG